MRVSLWALGALALFFGLFASRAKAESISPWWRLCADSNTIAIGTLHTPVDQLRTLHRGIPERPDNTSYMNATLDVAETLKGAPSSRIVVTFLPSDEPPGPTAETMIAMDGQRVMMFLRTVDTDRARGETKTYLAGYTPRALSVPTASDVTVVRTEVERQARVLREWRPHPSWPHHALVKALIEKTVHQQTAKQALKDLQALGPDAVPAMIDMMDDHRPVAEYWLVSENPPGFWEGHSMYAPELVVDAMAGILGRITGEGFGFIVNGASDEQRRLTVNGWRIYADLVRKKRVVPPS